MRGTPRGRRRRRAHRGRFAVGLALVIVIVAIWAMPAGAHTTLIESVPADRAVATEAPGTASLVFVNAVEPASVTLEVQRLDGGSVPGVERLTNGGDTETVEFALPDLADGVYGLTWQAIGPDGHRVAGEIVIGVGNDDSLAASVSDAGGFSSISSTDRMLDVVAGTARAVWYLAMAVVAGAVFVLWWRSRLADDDRALPTSRQLGSGGRYWARVGLGVSLITALVEWAVVVGIRYRALDIDGPTVDRVRASFESAGGVGWFLVVAAVVFLARPISAMQIADEKIADEQGADERGTTGAADAHPRRDLALTILLFGVACTSSMVAGHAATDQLPVLGTSSRALHLGAAALWVGPLLVVSLVAATAGWRSVDPGSRRRSLRQFFGDYANVALAAFAVVVLSGLATAWIALDGGWFDDAYGWTLAAKVGITIVVVVPLALFHDRTVRRDRSLDVAAGSARSETRGVGTWAFLRSVRVEVVVIALVIGLGAYLTTLDPGYADAEAAGGGDEAAAALLDSGVVEDVSTCAALEVGARTCYRDYFRGVMEAEDASAAVAEVDRLSRVDDFVAADCHQVAHDLGQDAVVYYGSFSEALSFEGSACWSGYYHGIVETELDGLSEEELYEVVPEVCVESARETYSFTHFNCLHGVGHGLMLTFDADLWAVIPLCQTLDDDPWEYRSCLGGAFMENIVTAQGVGGDGEPTLREDDLLYPCSALDGIERNECLLMQTSWVTYELDYDYAAAFAVCDGLDDEGRTICYQSMGRDLSGNSRLDVDAVVEGCALGADDYRWSCIRGAALNAVYDQHGTEAAEDLCAAVRVEDLTACDAAVAEAAATF